MSVKQRDPLTGHQTTGHEWNGITELNTRVPVVIWIFIAVTHIYALIAWILLPTWPLVTTYTQGLLGFDQRNVVEEQVREATVERSLWADQVLAKPYAEVQSDSGLMTIVQTTAPALFGDNCAACHGTNARGGPGFPDLTDKSWLWGGDPDTIFETLRVGVNADHPDTRISEMLAFGRDGMLTRDDIRTVIGYVQSLSGTKVPAETVSAGSDLFVHNCSSCHGEDAKGAQELGAADLTDNYWIYGGDAETLFTTVNNGRHGWMPAWETRLSDVDRKILTLYLLDLGKEASQ